MKTDYYVLYHSQCPDGFGAALAAWMALGDSASYQPMIINGPLADIPDGSRVIMVDFAYSRPDVDALAKRCQVVIIDHHETNLRAMAGLPTFELSSSPFGRSKEPGVVVHIDMNKSGAYLAWEYFHENKQVPLFFEYLQDRDLWRHKLAASKEFSAALQAYPYDFEVWKSLTQNVPKLLVEGEAILRFTTMLAAQFAAEAFMGKVGEYTVPCVNAPSALRSEVGNLLLRMYPDALFSAVFRASWDGKILYSLRGNGKINLSVFAEQFPGGGGHPDASGFQRSEWPEYVSKITKT
jgi:oligoribonuclease NrnB/cAMP/cGMP phosphodiesterase (DHH superfamily)